MLFRGIKSENFTYKRVMTQPLNGVIIQDTCIVTVYQGIK